jgi:pimeloyl-ACP methyl ester carboxylesterase
VHVAEAGAGEPLLLQHGWPQHWLAWRKLIPELAKDYRVICPDLRGHGWSDAPPGGYDKEQLATDLLAVLDALEIERARVVGHDWGGFASLLAALRAPERFERLGILSITTPWMNVSFEPKALAATIYQPIVASPLLGRQVVQRTGFARLLMDRGSGGSRPWTDDVLDSYAEQWREPERAAATVQVYRSFLTRDLPGIRKGRYRDARLSVPTLLLYGEDDLVITAERIGDWRSHSDDMDVQELPGVAHFVLDEAPEAVLERLVPFLR